MGAGAGVGVGVDAGAGGGGVSLCWLISADVVGVEYPVGVLFGSTSLVDFCF